MKTVVSALAFCILSACTDSVTLEGQFVGSVDAHPEQSITIVIAQTGDGVTAGSWISTTAFRRGVITAKKNLWGTSSYTLHVIDGDCKDEHLVTLKVTSEGLNGAIEKAKVCPSEVGAFTLKKTKGYF